VHCCRSRTAVFFPGISRVTKSSGANKVPVAVRRRGGRIALLFEPPKSKLRRESQTLLELLEISALSAEMLAALRGSP
jgi:hypothetical protein